jgi:nucleoside 2-deoxyribosyltransferase
MTTSEQRTRVYLSGPMFSDGDKAEQQALADALKGAGYTCHLPQRDGIEVGTVMQLLNDPANHMVGQMLEPVVLERCVAWVTRTVVALDVFQVVEGCEVTVLNIDGRVPDEGSLVEATLAWYAGHPVLPYKTTSISELDGNNNPMIGVISGWATVSSTPAEVVAAVKAAVKSGAAGRRPVTTPPLDVEQLIELGRVISGIRARRSLNKTQFSAAARTLATLSPPLMELLEPVPSLQPICQALVLAAIEFAKIPPAQKTRQQKIFKVEILALHKLMQKDPDIRKAMVKNHINA